MRLTSVQRRILQEADFTNRKDFDVANRVKYYQNLIRTGRLDVYDFASAAVLGDLAARAISEQYNENPPTINQPSDLLHMFGLDRESIAVIFGSIAESRSDEIAETPAWTIAEKAYQLAQNPHMRERDVISMAHRSLNQICESVPLNKIIEIVRPYLVDNPLLGGQKFNYPNPLNQSPDLDELL